MVLTYHIQKFNTFSVHDSWCALLPAPARSNCVLYLDAPNACIYFMCTKFYKHVEHILMRRNTWYMWTMYDAAVRISSALQPHSCSTDHSLTSSSSTNINSKKGRNLNKHVVLHVAFTIQKSYIDTPCILTIWWEKLLLKAFTNATRHQGWHQWSYTDATTSKKVVLLKTIKWEITVGKDNKRFQTTNAFVLYIYSKQIQYHNHKGRNC